MDYVQNILIKQLFAENVCSQGFYLVLERLLVCEVDLGKEGVVEREVLPGGDFHGDAAEHVEPEILEPGVDDVGMGIPGLDGALVDPALEIFLRFFVGKGAADDGPEGVLGGEEDGASYGNVEGRGSVAGKMGEKIQQCWLVRPHMDARHRNPVCPSVLRRFFQAKAWLHARHISSIVPHILHNILPGHPATAMHSKRPQHRRGQDSICLSSHACIYC